MRVLVAFTFMMFLNLLIYASQLSINEIGTENGITGPQFAYTNTFMNSAKLNGNNTLDTNVYKDMLPQSDSGIVATLGAYLFPFTIILNWVTSAGSFILSFLTAVPSFLVTMGLPSAISWALGFVWLSVATLLLLLGVIK